MGEYTPGPWVFDSDNVGQTSHAGYGLYAPDFESGEEFCYVLCSVEKTRKLGEGVPEANARLIAAAPQMYEALKIARANLQFLPPDDVVKQIDAALAAVEGKQAQP